MAQMPYYQQGQFQPNMNTLNSGVTQRGPRPNNGNPNGANNMQRRQARQTPQMSQEQMNALRYGGNYWGGGGLPGGGNWGQNQQYWGGQSPGAGRYVPPMMGGNGRDPSNWTNYGGYNYNLPNSFGDMYGGSMFGNPYYGGYSQGGYGPPIPSYGGGYRPGLDPGLDRFWERASQGAPLYSLDDRPFEEVDPVWNVGYSPDVAGASPGFYDFFSGRGRGSTGGNQQDYDSFLDILRQYFNQQQSSGGLPANPNNGTKPSPGVGAGGPPVPSFSTADMRPGWTMEERLRGRLPQSSGGGIPKPGLDAGGGGARGPGKP